VWVGGFRRWVGQVVVDAAHGVFPILLTPI
jgi:hypothetical protein